MQKSAAAAAGPWTTPGHPGFDGRTGTKLFDLTGKVAFVTGSSMGLGFGMAVGLAQAGAHVVINSRKEAACKEVVAKIKAMGCKATVCAFDVTDEKAVVAGFKKVKKQLGSVDILVNNGEPPAAVQLPGSPVCLCETLCLLQASLRPRLKGRLRTCRRAAGSTRRSEFLKSTTEDLDFVIDLNLRGPYICAREAGKIMKAQGGGKIINISSLMSVLGRATIQPYNATKFAINGLTRGLACELGPYNIQVNAIGPGYFVTDLTQVLLDNASFNKFVTTRTPLGYWGVPEDLQGAVIFLASPASNYVSGHNLMVDGGMSTSAADSLLPLLPDQEYANGRE